jgi:hypothetical protein
LQESHFWLAEASPQSLDAFINHAWSALSDLAGMPKDLPDGVGEIAVESGHVAYAVDRTEHFVAIKMDHLGQAGQLMRAETFFVCPKSSSGQIQTARVGGRKTVTSVLPGLAPARDVWNDIAARIANGPVSTEGKKVPSFLELTAVLTARGKVSISDEKLRADLADKEHELDYYTRLANETNDELRQVRSQLKFAVAALARQEQSSESAEVASGATEIMPWDDATDLSWLQEWADSNANRIIIDPRAYQGAKKSRFQSPRLVHACLELLAGPYRELRTGLIDRDAFQSAIEKVGVQLRGSTTETAAGTQGDAYYISHKGRRTMLDLHLLRGGGRDERYCMRIYFCWDDDAKKVVVGWLPSHLDNSLT